MELQKALLVVELLIRVPQHIVFALDSLVQICRNETVLGDIRED